MTFSTSVRQVGAGAALAALALMGAGCTTTSEDAYSSSGSAYGYRTAQGADGGVPVVFVGSPRPADSSRQTRATGSGSMQNDTSWAQTGGTSAQSQTGRASGQEGTDAQASDQTEWTIPLYSETLRVGKREVESGEVRLRKVIKTETVNQPVELSREVLVIERMPAGESQIASTAENAFQEKELVIDLKEEEPVIEKELQLTGRIVARKDTQDRQETVQSEVRTEDITLDRSGESDQIKLIGQFNTSESAQEASGGTSAQGQVGRAQGGGEDTQGEDLFGVSQPSSLIGREVSLPRVSVQGVLGDRLLQVGPDQSRTFVVRTAEPINNIQAGDQVRIGGTVRDLPDNLTDWNANDQSMEMLQSREVYIDATEIQKSSE